MLTTAFILGIAGSFHCVGMCSPLAFAVAGMKKSLWMNRLIYNLGRIFTYGVLGAVVSAIGVALPLEKFQSWLSVGMGILLISAGIFNIGKVKFQAVNALARRAVGCLKLLFSLQIKRKGTFSTILLGAINGMLPCGLSLLALSTCLIAPSALEGLYFMLLFGIGTLPAMLGVASLVQYLVTRFHLSYHRVNTLMLIVAGSLLIARVYFNHEHQTAVSAAPGEIEICR